MIVFTPEIFNHHTGFRQCPKLLPVETLVLKPTVKTLRETVLPRTARINVQRILTA